MLIASLTPVQAVERPAVVPVEPIEPVEPAEAF